MRFPWRTVRGARLRVAFFLALVVLLAVLGAPGAGEASHVTFVVNYNTQDLADVTPGDGVCDAGFSACSLRAAIQEANAHAGTDTINFSIGSGTPYIQIGNTGLSDLPTITGPVNINGNTGGATRVEMNGFNAGALGLKVAGGNSVIEGLVISDFVLGGIWISSDDNTLRNSRIGTDSSGTLAKGNGGGINPISTTIDPGGVMITGNGNTIGGASAGQGNLISGNDEYGLLIYGDATVDNIVAGNYIGTDFTGNSALANGLDGVHVAASDENTIGGTTAAARNVISGNGGSGILVADLVICTPSCQTKIAHYNNILGNHIGISAAGTSAVPNASYGVYLSSPTNCIGSVYDFPSGRCSTPLNGRNVISGNNASGVRLSAANGVQGNYIGTNAAGTAAISNAVDGIELPGAYNNVIGGTTAAARNVISGNTLHGIHSSLNHTSSNFIHGNYIGLNAAGTAAIGNGGNGIRLESTGANHEIKGNAISGNGFDGIRMTAGASVSFIGENFIGTNATGTADVGNTEAGILIENNNNQVGSLGRNIISGNQDGIVVRGGATANSFLNNYIGTDVTGTVDLGNDRYGLSLSESPGGTGYVGGNSPGLGNLISGNGSVNLRLTGPGTQGYTIVNNIIGPDVNGSGAAMSNGVGIQVTAGVTNTTIGPGNVIADNTNGVEISDSSTTRIVLKGSKIGTNLTGASAVPNSGSGVFINGSPGNTIGGNTAADGNTIAFNGLDGVRVSGAAATSNAIRSNSIHSNGGLAIDLDPDGVTANDGAPDSDSGPNNLQNFPVINLVITGASTNTNIHGTIASGASAGFNLDFFESATCDGSGNGEGQVLFGSSQTATDGSGNGNFITNFPSVVPAGHVITMTATRISTPFDTSEFSSCKGAGPLVVDTTADPTITGCQPATDNDCSLRGAIALATSFGASGTPGDLITFDATDFPPPPAAPGVIIIGSTLSLVAAPGEDTIDATGRGVLIDGAGEPSAFPCLDIQSPGNTVRGLQITDCTIGISLAGGSNVIGPDNVIFDIGNFGIAASGPTGNVIKGNKVGTNAAGTAVHPDGGNNTGVNINGSGNIIGGSAVDRNIISGNGTGISITANGSNNNVVKGNYIGTDITGTIDLGNTFSGINIATAANSNVIGGTAPGEGNLISGNNQHGVRLFGNTSVGRPTGTTIQGNLIGTNAGGTAALGNGMNGIVVDGAIGTCIGGTVIASVCAATPGGGNLISGNAWNGVLISGVGGTGNRLYGNMIGTNTSGTGALGNGLSGVYMVNNGNAVGGTAAGGGNAISHNGQDGVTVETGTGNTIRGNSIYLNGVSGIGNYFGGNGEPGHAPPVITSIGSANGTTCPNCAIDVYSDNGDEGRVYHGSTVADGAGNWSYAGAVVGPNVTATATDANGNTSEFSGPFACTGASDEDGDSICNSGDICPSWANPSQALPDWPIPAGDADCDGFPGSVAQPNLAPESYLGTDPTKHCAQTSTRNDEPGADVFPMDFDDSRYVNGQDILAYNFAFGISTSGPDIVVPGIGTLPRTRFDLNQSGFINGSDILRFNFFFGKFCA